MGNKPLKMFNLKWKVDRFLKKDKLSNLCTYKLLSLNNPPLLIAVLLVPKTSIFQVKFGVATLGRD